MRYKAQSFPLGKALSLISHCRKEKAPNPPLESLGRGAKSSGSLCTIFHETNYPPSKIFQSSNLPIFQSSNLPIFQSSNLPAGSLSHDAKSSGSFPQSSEVQENKRLHNLP
jgi:hypothetical protein